ncbi:hypothetical protein [Rhodococcus wratislaviensis]|uniref:hypothetical protein n=1 Tax=Rhodococcus wratislaviensis TaxID=44752 RepID=UPI003650896F
MAAKSAHTRWTRLSICCRVDSADHREVELASIGSPFAKLQSAGVKVEDRGETVKAFLLLKPGSCHH